MIPAPVWLYYVLGALMFAVAAYGGVVLAVSAPAHRRAGRDVELSHVVMGLAMAGMFVPAWSFGPNVLWQLVFGVLLAWFVARTVHSVRRYGLHVPHYAIHAVMSLAMLLMYWFPRGARVGAMAMVTSGGARMDPGLSFVLSFVLFGSAVFTVASPDRGATHYGTHEEDAPPSPLVSSDEVGAPVVTAAVDVEGVIGSPGLLDASHVVMCVAMGFMLVLMI